MRCATIHNVRWYFSACPTHARTHVQRGDLTVNEGSIEPTSRFFSVDKDEETVWIIEDRSLELNEAHGSTAFLTFMRANSTVYEATGEIIQSLDRYDDGSPFSLWYD